MPLYRITAPNGQTYQIEGPEGASDADVAKAVMAQHPDAGGAAPKQSTIGSELKRGAQQVASSMQTAYGALTGSPEEAAQRGVERGQAISQVAGEGVGFEPVKRAYQEKGLLSAAGEAVSQIPRALAGQGANLATMAGGARLGAMAGSALGPAGTIGGGILGAGAALYPQFFGANVERQAGEQMERGEPVKIDRAKAGVAAAGQAALEGAGSAFTLGKGVVKGILGVTDDAILATAKSAQQLEAAAKRSLTGTVARGAGRGVATELPVEVAQQVIERAQAGLDLTSPDAMKEYGEAAYQAGLIGGALGGAGNVVNRSQARTQVEAQDRARAEAARAAAPQPGPQLTPETPAGTQGALFTPEEMGPTVKAPTAPAAPAPTTNVLPGQQDLGLDFARTAEDATLERERLKQQPQTPEVKARIAELNAQLLLSTQSEVEAIRADKERTAAAAEQEAKARKKFPGLANAPDLISASDVVKARTQGELFPAEELGGEFAGPQIPPDAKIAEPTLVEKKPYQYKMPLRTVLEGRTPNRDLTIPARPGEITLQNLQDTGVPMRTSKTWLEQNVVGKTQQEVQRLVDKDPTLIVGPGQRAKMLRELLAQQPAKFEEPPSVTTPTAPPAVEQGNQPRGGEPSLEVPSQPAAPIVSQPEPGAPRAAGAPAAPVGRGLVPTGRPIGEGNAPQGSQPTAVTAEDLHTQVRALKAEQQALLTKAGRVPAVNSKARAKWDTLGEQIVQKKAERDALDQTERAAKKTNAPQATPPTQARKPAPAPAAPAAPKAPSPAVAAETVAEEAARKAEAEDFKRRLEAVERKQKEVPPAPKAEAPKAEKAEPKELPEKLREPIGTSEFGMEEGKKEILRGPQGMLFPMSKREEIEYAERKKPEEPEEKPPTKDERQREFDFTAAKKEEAKPTKPAVAEWAASYDYPGSTAVYADDDIALIRKHNMLGDFIYAGMTPNGVTRVDIENYTGPMFTPAQKAKLDAERAKAVFADSKAFAKNPAGPFTGATTNIAKSDSVDQRYADYLQELTQTLGLGDVRIFLVHPQDMRAPGALDKYKLYKGYASALTANPTSEGAKRVFGPALKDFYISIQPNMSEAKTLDTLAHELGHAIQNIAYDTAPVETRKAIRDEYDAWLASTKGKTARELIHMLRNRESVGDLSTIPAGKQASEMEPYWTSFSEWFADNVSRWATTADKPLSITEKFFSKVAQMMRDLVAAVTGRKYPPAKTVAAFMDKMGPGAAADWMGSTNTKSQPLTRAEFSVSASTESLVDSMGPLDAEQKSGLSKLITGVKANPDVDYVTKFRTQTADIAATIEQRLRTQFDGAVRDSLGKVNPMGLYRQAQDYSKMLLEYFQTGTLSKDPVTGLWKSGVGKGVRPPAEVYALIDKYAEKNGYTRERATQVASRVLEGVRLDGMRASNKTGATSFKLHLNDNEIDQLVREYNADPDLKEMSKLMDEARIAMVNNLVKVGRLTKEQGDEWKSVVGYVPFDRIEDFATKFSSAKKISTKGLSQLGKLPELIGSDVRPVGNVFDNYINTLGWMVGQTLKTDATVQTLRSLEDIGQAKYLGRSSQAKPNTVGAYIDGEMMYWELPSKYDLMAFKDLTPPKAGWLRALGEFSNVLRKSVTVLPPFALKQVTDDVQRAILTSGVKNPGALIRMSLTNFGGMAWAELRGIQHPSVKEFGALGLTGEYDFQAGKPATSLLKDLGYKKRGKFENLLHRLDGITRASDLAVRKAIYDQTLKEGGDTLLAQTRAREFINFRRRGGSDFVGAMVTTIPFFNAYIQGMDVLYRAASGKDSSSSIDRAQARRMFWSRARIAFTMSSLYALGKDDEDEDYKEMDLRTRDSNWILPGGYKIPVPGELGAVFKVIPERIVEYMRRQGTPEEQTAFEAMRTTLTYMYEQYLGRVNPVPQAIKPVLEAWANKSFLTGRALEGYHHQAMDPSMRVTEQTSELAKAIATFSRDTIGVETSPIMIDNALRGYFGSSAAMLTMVTDSLLNPTRVDRPLHKYALLSNYMYDPVGTRRMTEFYEEREKVGKANTTLNELMKTDLGRAEQYANDHQDELALEGAVNSTLNQLENTRAYRKFLNSPEGAKDMPTDEREAALKEIKSMEVEYVKWVREAKAELANAQR